MAAREECSETDRCRDGELVSLSYDGEEFQAPKELLEDVRKMKWVGTSWDSTLEL